MAQEDFKEFIANLKAVGLPTASRFYVMLPNASNTLCMMVDQCSLPGLTLMTTEMRTFGEVREAPYGITYPPVQISTIVDNNSEAKIYFENWANLVFDRETRTSGYYKGSGKIEGYAKDIDIVLTDKGDTPIYKVRLYEAFPKTVSDIQLDYSNKDIIRLQVSLAYRYWKRDELTGADIAAVKTTVALPSIFDTLQGS